MGGNLDRAVAATRVAVRQVLQQRVSAGEQNVVVALSGGADSLALMAACAFETEKLGMQLFCGVVDHGLQSGSAEVAARAVLTASQFGAVAQVLETRVMAAGSGPEAAAREARYAALGEYCSRVASKTLLLGHTLNDQAEQVLLGLARGSGIAALAGMPKARLFSAAPDEHTDGLLLVRPFLELTRADTEQACRAQKLDFWCDPHNSDPRFLRSRVRTQLMPQLANVLGATVQQNLARSASLLTQDVQALNEIAQQCYTSACVADDGERVVLLVDTLSRCPVAIAKRVIRLAAGALGVTYTAVHTERVASLVFAWHGQKQLQLPGTTVERKDAKIIFTKTLPPQVA